MGLVVVVVLVVVVLEVVEGTVGVELTKWDVDVDLRLFVPALWQAHNPAATTVTARARTMRRVCGRPNVTLRADLSRNG
jgi:hypothetical protein